MGTQREHTKHVSKLMGNISLTFLRTNFFLFLTHGAYVLCYALCKQLSEIICCRYQKDRPIATVLLCTYNMFKIIGITVINVFHTKRFLIWT